ncbi:sensor histidine kinase [Treponema sp.]|uniref:sensor histidine kinase n=1 Tax=Treponema sp. TaxID=166 RepID=UPI00388D4940
MAFLFCGEKETMKHRNSILAVLIFLAASLFFGCRASGNPAYINTSETYRLWTELHSSKSLQSAEAFFESIEQYDFDVLKLYPNVFLQSQSDKLIMAQHKQELLELLKKYEVDPSSDLEIKIDETINKIDILMINYIQRRNYIVEETQHRYKNFYIILIVVILATITILLLLNERELKKKDNRISQSESFLKHTMEVQETERSRISRELHDTVAQSMRYVSILAEKISDKELADTIISVQNDNIEDIRKMCYNLAPPNFKNMNIIDTLNVLADKIFDKNITQVRIVTNGTIDFSAFSDEQFINIYRVIQELFQNIRKHAQASEVTVLFRDEDVLKIIISDDGIGMNSKMISDINSRNFDLHQNLHFGIQNILERLQLLDGTIEFRSTEDCGTSVFIELKKNP